MGDAVSRQAALDEIIDAQGKKMNRQRKVLITITYNEMGIIIDTKAEEVAQPTCNQLATDTISRQAALDDIETVDPSMLLDVNWVKNWVKALPSVQPEVIRCKDCIRYHEPSCLMAYDGKEWSEDNGFCHVAGRRTDGTEQH